MDLSPLICASEALDLHPQADVKFVDATWYMPNMNVDAFEVFCDEHIPGAVHFDIDHVSDKSSELPHMYPSQERFEKCAGEMGISETDRLVIYDRGKYVASARVWWMFLSFGHQNVQVLNGGLSAWKAAGGKLEDGLPQPSQTSYRGKFDADSIILHKEMLSVIDDPSVAIVDARSAGRFNGTEPEPRPGLRGGHIPRSTNLYYGDVMNQEGIMKSPDEIQSLFEKHRVGDDTPVVTTCGSGVTAAILLLALYQVRTNRMRLYDGSWTQWALSVDSLV